MILDLQLFAVRVEAFAASKATSFLYGILYFKDL